MEPVEVLEISELIERIELAALIELVNRGDVGTTSGLSAGQYRGHVGAT